jgi:hemoglobin-like flavoprotein
MSITRHPLCAAGTLKRLADAPLDHGLIRRLQDSFHKIARPEVDLAGRFYGKLFERHPHLRSMFPADLERQKQKFQAMMLKVVDDLRDPDATLTALTDLGRHHAGIGVKPEHYPPVVDVLIDAIGEASGADWTPQLAADWAETLTLMSAAMVQGALTAPPQR